MASADQSCQAETFAAAQLPADHEVERFAVDARAVINAPAAAAPPLLLSPLTGVKERSRSHRVQPTTGPKCVNAEARSERRICESEERQRSASATALVTFW